jgi:hypothetical protein
LKGFFERSKTLLQQVQDERREYKKIAILITIVMSFLPFELSACYRFGLEAHYDYKLGPSLAVTFNCKTKYVTAATALHYFPLKKSGENILPCASIIEPTLLDWLTSYIMPPSDNNAQAQPALSYCVGAVASGSTKYVTGLASCHYSLTRGTFEPAADLLLNEENLPRDGNWIADFKHKPTRILARSAFDISKEVTILLATKKLNQYNYQYNTAQITHANAIAFMKKSNELERKIEELNKLLS